MRIVNLIQCANLGGMEQASLRLMRALMARGHELRVVSLNPIGVFGELLSAADIPARGLDYGNRGKLSTMVDLASVLRRETPDAMIMTGHNFAASLALGDVCHGRRILTVHFYHEGVMPAWRWKSIYGLARRRFNAITFPSEFSRKEAVCLCPRMADICHVVRNPLEMPGLPTGADRAAFRKQLGVPPEVYLVGNAGWLVPTKRFDVFLETAARLMAHRSDLRFVIAGDGPERPNLERLAASLGLTDKVIWLGWLKNLGQFYAALDVLLFNSDRDAMGMTPLEAVSHLVPIVVSMLQGGLPEILDDESGWMINRHDPDLLARLVLEALSPEGKRRAAVGRNRVAQASDPHRIAATIEDLLLGEPPGEGRRT